MSRRRPPSTSTWRRLLVPSAVSLAVHAGLLTLVATVTWTVAHAPRDTEPPPLLTLAQPTPPRATRPTPQPDPASQPPDRVADEPSRGTTTASAPRADLTPAPLPAAASLPSVPPDLRPPALAPSAPPAWTRAEPDARFAGLTAQRARDVVFVVDASGPMTTSFSLVAEQLARSLDRLAPDQRFQLVCYRDRSAQDPAAQPTIALHGGDLLRATPHNIAHAREWLLAVAPSGRSNPLAGLTRAVRMQPDAVFLLARSIPRSAGSVWGAGQDQILATLNQLNPTDPRTGTRRVQIQTIQFLDDDPTGTMQAIARTHGPGARSDGSPTGYRLLTLADLRHARERPAGDPSAARLLTDDAARTLAELESSGDALGVLVGLPVKPRAQRVTTAARRALSDLDEAAALDQSADPESPHPRRTLLRARALLLLAAAGAPADAPDLARAALALSNQALADPATLRPDALELARLTRAHALVRTGAAPESIRPLPEGRAGLEALAAEMLAAPADRTSASISDYYAALKLPPLDTALLDPAAVLASVELAARLSARATDHPARLMLETNVLFQRMLDEPALSPDADARRALVLSRLAAWPWPDVPDHVIPPLARYARARAALDTESPDARDDGYAALVLACDDPRPWPLRDEALWDLAHRAQARGDHARALNELAALALDHTESPRSLPALDAALTLAAPGDPPSNGPLYRELLARAESIGFDLTDPWRWRLERARTHPNTHAALDLLEVAPLEQADAPVRARTARLHARLSTERAEQLVRDGADPAPALRRRWIVAARLSSPDTPRFALELAEALLVREPAESLALLTDLDTAPTLDPVRVRLTMARAHLAAGDQSQADRLLGPLADSLDPSHPLHWPVWTLRLESAAALGAESGSAERQNARVRAHVIRLRTLDTDLGGPPWQDRLEALSTLD